jgi:2',3'-cyclic-nucleotide 2'-phosphodiesterase (5'-nucleotidase family)
LRILGGHDHLPIDWYEDGVLIHKSGAEADWLGVIDLTIDTVEGNDGPRVTVLPTWQMLANRGVASDPQVGGIIAGYAQQLDAELAIVIGKTTTALDSRRASVRGEETAIGNLIADAIRESVGADIGLTNGGGIRGDRTYEAGVELTRKDILSELPFGNVTTLVEVSGADLVAALENGVSQVEDGGGRFPQVSGISFTFDATKPAGSRVSDVKVAGQPIDPAATYKVATNDFMLNGGDGYTALGKGTTLIDKASGTLMANAVMAYIEAKGEISPATEGRITRAD